MKVLSFAELQKLSAEKLAEELEKISHELFRVKFEIQSSQSKNVHLLRNYKKYVSQIKTILNSQPKNHEI